METIRYTAIIRTRHTSDNVVDFNRYRTQTQTVHHTAPPLPVSLRPSRKRPRFLHRVKQLSSFLEHSLSVSLLILSAVLLIKCFQL